MEDATLEENTLSRRDERRLRSGQPGRSCLVILAALIVGVTLVAATVALVVSRVDGPGGSPSRSASRRLDAAKDLLDRVAPQDATRVESWSVRDVGCRLSSSGQIVGRRYRSPGPLEATVSFYAEQLAQRGWNRDDSAAPTDSLLTMKGRIVGRPSWVRLNGIDDDLVVELNSECSRELQ